MVRLTFTRWTDLSINPNLLAILVAVGVLYPAYGIPLRPEVSALLMSIFSTIVATNAVSLNRAEKSLI